MQLIITEKPSVAKDIAKVLKINHQKQGYFENESMAVTWAFGHLIRLINPDDYDEIYKNWSLDHLPIMPDTLKKSLIPDSRSEQQFHIIANLLKNPKTTEVICATDAGREGELIFRFIYQMADCTLPIKRLWISSQTDKAIKEGFDSLKDGKDYDNLFDSALCRTEADWIVGMNATRAYTIQCSRGAGVMSVGRVQSPVLKLIVDRYRAHSQFTPETFHEILAHCQHENGNFIAKWHKEKESRLKEKKDAEALLDKLNTNPNGQITLLNTTEKKEKQPLLYDLTELQKDANKQFKYSADQTLKLMQSLYENHKILSYPRTSSRYLSDDIAPKLPSLVDTLKEHPKFKNSIKEIQEQNRTIAKRIIDNKKVTDHHAIIPTDKRPDYSRLNPDESNIYNLVIQRFLAAFLPECIKEHTEIHTSFQGEVFKCTGTVIREAGWRSIYGKSATSTSNDKKGKDEEETLLPPMQKGDPITAEKFSLETGKTKAPALYTEASILAAMETAGKQIDDEELRDAMKDSGLGTPATRAQILERLITVGYILRDKNKLVPTAKGESIINAIIDEELTSPELTGNWEKKLLDMAQGNYSRSQYMTEIRDFTKRIIENVKNTELTHYNPNQKSLGYCPACNGQVIETKLSYACANWKSRACKFTIWKGMAGKTISESMAKELLKKGHTKTLKNFKNKEGKPFNAALMIKDGKVQFKFDNSDNNHGPCPLCKDGTIIETPKAFGCNLWRDTGCSFTIWKNLAGKVIDKTLLKTLLKNEKTEKIDGFKSRAGKPFSAALKLQENGKIDMIFD